MINRLKGMRTYLAGAMDRVPDGGVVWRDKITPLLESKGVVVLNPCDKPVEVGIEDASTRTIGYLSLTTGSTSDSGFIAYEDLTEATVLNWIQANVDQPTVETENSASIAADVVARAAIVKRTGTPW